MSNRANALRYTPRYSGGGSNSLDLFGIRSHRRMKEARELSDIDVSAQQRLLDLQQKYESEMAKLEAQYKEEAAKNDFIRKQADKFGITVEDYISKVAPLNATNTVKKANLESGSLDTSVAKNASDAGVAYGLSGINPNNLIKEVQPNSLLTTPNIPGLTGPLETGLGISTLAGQKESKLATEIGGTTLPNGMVVGAKPVLQTAISGGGERTFPVNPDLLMKASQMQMDNTTPSLDVAPSPDGSLMDMLNGSYKLPNESNSTTNLNTSIAATEEQPFVQGKTAFGYPPITSMEFWNKLSSLLVPKGSAFNP